MLSFVIRKGRLEPREKPVPALRPGWAVARVRLAGICNTDIELLRGYLSFRGTPGHEFVGEVVRCGEARWLGRRVVGEINISCLSLRRKAKCSYCRRSLPTHCLHRRVLGIRAHDGAYAEFLTLPLVNLHPVPATLSDAKAVFTEPLAAACQVLEQVRAREHREAAVLGDGKLAQLIARVLRVAGLRVVMFGKHAGKLALARRAGIAALRVPRGRRTLRAQKAKYSLVVEATGSPSGLARAQQMIAPRGTLVLKSTFHGAVSAETWPIVVHELALRPVSSCPRVASRRPRGPATPHLARLPVA